MINFIIYEDNIDMVNLYTMVIKKLMMINNDLFNITSINKYEDDTLSIINQLDGKKIIICDIEVPGKNGIELARNIRNNGDWLSPIIIVTSHEELNNTGFTSRLLMLDFILKKDDFKNDLFNSLKVAYEIISTHKCLKFKHNGEYYQIPYNNIYYIEKDLNDNYCTIYTNNNCYKYKITINNLSNILDNNFIKTSRSCIVNMNNIVSVDFANNEIKFDNKSIYLISRDYKKEFKSEFINRGTL